MKLQKNFFQSVGWHFISLCLLLLSFEGKGQDYKGLGVESVKPEELAKYAPKPAEPALMTKIQSYLDLRSPGMGHVTDDGTRMVFNWGVTGVSQVWRVDGPNQFPKQMTGGKDSTSVAGISADGKWQILSRDRNGEENPGLFLQSLTGGGPLITIQQIPKARVSMQALSNDKKAIYYKVNDLKPDSYTMYRFETSSRKTTKIFDREGLWSLRDEFSDGKFLMRKATGSLTSEWYEFDLKTNELSPILGEGELGEYELSYTKLPGKFLVETNKFGEFRRLYLYDSKTKKFDQIGLNVDADVTGASMDPTRSRVIYGVNERGYEKIYALNTSNWKSARLPDLPKADLTYYGEWSNNGRFLVVGTASARDQFRVGVIDWVKGKVSTWTTVSAPEVDISRFSEVSLESYKSRDGVEIPMFVRRPEKCKASSCPVVVSFHGGPEGQSQPGFSTRAQLFVDEGFIFVEPNVRGSSGYGKSWISSDDGEKRLKVLSDIEDCSIHIKKNWAINGAVPKIGVTGGSYGGYATLVAMTKFAGSYDAGVSIVGMSNLVTFLKNTAPYRRALRVSEYGDPDRDEKALTELSPSTYVDKVKAPLLIIQGATDPRVPVGEAIQMHEAMQKRSLPSDLVIFADEGHGSQKRDNRALEIANTLAFFKKYLTPTEVKAAK